MKKKTQSDSQSDQKSGLAGAFALAIACLSLTACASNQTEPTSSSEKTASVSVSEARADESLVLMESSTAPLVEENEAQAAATVRWGGTITRIENKADQRTEVEVVSRPLRGNGRPVHNDRSDGRFIAVVDSFLDPEIVQVGRDLTIFGTLRGRKAGLVGDTDYVFPVVKVSDYTYWKRRQAAQRHFPHWNERRYLYHDPFWPNWILFHPHRHLHR